MIEKEIEVKITSGLETRPIAKLVQVAGQFESRIYITLNDKKVNAKSIMGMMSLGVIEGEKLLISADGKDEKEAMEAIEKYLSEN